MANGSHQISSITSPEDAPIDHTETQPLRVNIEATNSYPERSKYEPRNCFCRCFLIYVMISPYLTYKILGPFIMDSLHCSHMIMVALIIWAHIVIVIVIDTLLLKK